MAILPLDDSIPRFQANEDRINVFTNGDAVTDMETSGGQQVPSIRKIVATKTAQIDNEIALLLGERTNYLNGRIDDLIDLKNGEINIAADGVLAGAVDARDKAADWAEKDVDAEVEAGKYSARHHAVKAAAASQQVGEDISHFETLIEGISELGTPWDETVGANQIKGDEAEAIRIKIGAADADDLSLKLNTDGSNLLTDEQKKTLRDVMGMSAMIMQIGQTIFDEDGIGWPGFVPCDGQDLVPGMYPEYEAYRTARGKNPHKAPDWRDRVLRHAGDLAGAAGTVQEDQVGPHKHNYNQDSTAGSSGSSQPEVLKSGWSGVADETRETAILPTGTGMGGETRVKAVVGKWFVKVYGDVIDPGTLDLAAIEAGIATITANALRGDVDQTGKSNAWRQQVWANVKQGTAKVLEGVLGANSSSLDIPLNVANFAGFRILVDLVPTVVGAAIWGRLSSDGVSYAAANGDYMRDYILENGGGSVSGDAASSSVAIVMASSMGATSGEGAVLRVDIPFAKLAGGRFPRIQWHASVYRSNGTQITMIGSATRKSAVQIAGIQFLCDSGLIQAGARYRVYGDV